MPDRPKIFDLTPGELKVALACLKLCTNHADQEAIRRVYGIPAPYQVCPLCQDHRCRCKCGTWA